MIREGGAGTLGNQECLIRQVLRIWVDYVSIKKFPFLEFPFLEFPFLEFPFLEFLFWEFPKKEISFLGVLPGSQKVKQKFDR